MTVLAARELTAARSQLLGYDQGAQVARWDRDGVPVVWLSEQAVLAPGRAIRGGVPVCWPWFANGPAGDATPAHGFLRTAPWRLVEQTDTTITWQVTHDDVAGEPGTDRFPHRFTAEVGVELGDGLTIALAVTNDDGRPFGYEAALHTYLHVADVHAAEVIGLDDVPFHDKVDQVDRVQQGPLRLTGHTDRIYRTCEPVVVRDPVLGRRTTVTGAGQTHAVLWNPWSEQAARLADLGDTEWATMLCVETAAIGPDAIHLDPGETHTMSSTITVDAG